MSDAAERSDLVRQWLLLGDQDLTNAKHTLTLRADCPLETVCFHAQQCVVMRTRPRA